MATSEQVDAILRDDYKDYWDNLNNKTFMLSQIETKTDTVQGRIARHAIHTGRSGGIGARREGVALPTADQQRYATVPVPVRWQTGRIQLTVQLMKMADGEPGAFINALEREMDIKNDIARDMNRQIHGTSNGVIAQCTTTSSSTTINLATTTTATEMRHFYVGRHVDIGTVASPNTIAAARQITAVDVANKTITISGSAVSTTSSHYVFNQDSGGASDNSGTQDDGQSELTGLQTIVSDSTTLHTLTVASYPIWKAQVSSNSGTTRPFSETTLDLLILNNMVESGESINALVSNVGAFVAGKAVMSAYQRNVDTVEFKGGFRGIKWATPGVSGIEGGDIGWFADFDCKNNRIYGLNFNGLVCHQIGDAGWQWMDEDGAILSRVSNQLAYEAVIYNSFELACARRNAHFVYDDVAEAS